VPSSTMASDQDDLSAIPDHKLKESIQSKKRTLDVTGKNLPDNGAKLRATIDRYQQELSRRESMRLSKVPLPRFLSCGVSLRHLFSRVFPFICLCNLCYLFCYLFLFILITYVLFVFWFSFVEQEVDGDQKPQPEQTTSSSAITKGRFSPLCIAISVKIQRWSM